MLRNFAQVSVRIAEGCFIRSLLFQLSQSRVRCLPAFTYRSSSGVLLSNGANRAALLFSSAHAFATRSGKDTRQSRKAGRSDLSNLDEARRAAQSRRDKRAQKKHRTHDKPSKSDREKLRTKDSKSGSAKRTEKDSRTARQTNAHRSRGSKETETDTRAGAEAETDAKAATGSKKVFNPLGWKIAILGRPNVGKSTLFNRLAGRYAHTRAPSHTHTRRQLALVHATPGVTRDRREADAFLSDLQFRVIDTAGLEEVSGYV